ncbi:MAG: hypothetical protein KGQ36_06845 [Rickettsiales bacterium]|nr:hypothetical protein [Rickettsiales bacterium]
MSKPSNEQTPKELILERKDGLRTLPEIEREELLIEYLNEYKKKTTGSINGTLDPKKNILEACEYCSQKLFEKKITEISPDLKAAHKEFTDAVSLLQSQSKDKTEYQEKVQKWKNANPEIISKKNLYNSTLSTMSEESHKTASDFVKKHYEQESTTSATKLNSRDRSATI